MLQPNFLALPAMKTHNCMSQHLLQLSGFLAFIYWVLLCAELDWRSVHIWIAHVDSTSQNLSLACLNSMIGLIQE